MKYIRIWDIKALLKGNEPGQLVEKAKIDRKKIKKIEIGQKHLLTYQEKGKIYILSKITETVKNK
jgi:hypothetical protein